MPLKDLDKRTAYNLAYRAKRREEFRVRERERYKQPGYKEKQQAYRRANLEKYAEYQRDRRRRLPEEHLYIQAKSRAKKFGVPFAITMDDIDWVTHCPIFGVRLNYRKNEGTLKGWKIRSASATLDRRDNTLGYVPGNVFVISHRANRMKSDFNTEEVMAVVQYMKNKPEI
jgi:hypothetical protein